ncbi:hypothetical protein ACHAWF_005545, partial [Thalassiosira exigua]
STGEVLRELRSCHRSGLLHDASTKSPREILEAGYPRGRKEVASLLTKHFPPAMQRRWFEDRGVRFRTERDGSLVSADDSSDDICAAILKELTPKAMETGAKVTSIAKDGATGEFLLTINGGRIESCDCVVLASGNSHLGHRLASSLGHTIAKPARSCFSFRLKDGPMFSHLQDGVQYLLPHVRISFKVKVEGQKRPRTFKSEGPAYLEAHDGAVTLGGAAASSLSSLAAFELKHCKFRGRLIIHFVPDQLGGKVERIEEHLWQHRQDHPHEAVGDRCPLVHRYVDYDEYDWENDSFRTIATECVPRDVWRGLAEEACGASPGSPWSKMSPKRVRNLAEAAVGRGVDFVGRRTTSGDPFVNAGGILLDEVDVSTMDSKVAEGLFCCGQVLDGDGGRGGFSFMRDFATGKLAGESAVAYALRKVKEGVR